MRVSSWLHVYTYSSKRGCSKVVPHLMDHAPTPPWFLQLHATKPYENADKCKSVDGRARVLRDGSCYQLLPASLLRRAAMKVTVKEF